MTQLNLTFAQIKSILFALVIIAAIALVYYKYASWKNGIYQAGFQAGRTEGASTARASCQEDIKEIQNAPWRRKAPPKPGKSCGFDILCWVGS